MSAEVTTRSIPSVRPSAERSRPAPAPADGSSPRRRPVPADAAPRRGGTDALRRHRAREARRLVVSDAVVLVGVLGGIELTGTLPSWGSAPWHAALLTGLWMVLLAGCRTRTPDVLHGPGGELRRVLGAGAAMTGLVAVLDLILLPTPLRLWAVLAVPCAGLMLLLSRAGWRRRRRRRLVRGDGLRRAMLVGEQRKVDHLAEHLRSRSAPTGLSVVTTLTDDAPTGDGSGRSGSLLRDDVVDQVRDAATQQAVDTVILTGSDALTPEVLHDLGWAAVGLDIDVFLAPSLTDVAEQHLLAWSAGGMPLLHAGTPALSGSSRRAKRAVDMSLAGLALLLLAPLMLVTALAIRLDSPGPALFRQTRVGLDHRRFAMLKFRSMVLDAEDRREELRGASDGNAILFKLRRDPRVTRVGRVIRRFSIDELPQLANVLRGEMSLVGPRPPLVHEVDDYDENAARRLLVTPGITGLWQVEGRSDLSWQESVRLDLYYVRNWSPSLDLRIMLRTVRAVADGRGAY